MMLNINFIPIERRKKGFPVHKLYILGVYLVLATTLLLWGYNLFMFKYSEAKLKNVQEGVASLHLWQERFELNQLQNSELKKRGDIVTTLSKSRILWSDYLADLGNVTPYGVWLTSVSQDASKANNITIEGNALKMEQLLTFINNLQNDPKVSAVALIKTQTAKAAGNSSVDISHFIINVTRNGGQTSAK